MSVSKKLPKHHQEIPYLRNALAIVNEFQERIRREGAANFNVWIFLEEEFAKDWSFRYRQPPSAKTIFSWFNPDPITGTKMGVEDFRLIFKYIGNPSPIISYYEECMLDYSSADEPVAIEPKPLERHMHANSILLGKIYEEFENGIADDNMIDKKEAKRIIVKIDDMVNHLKVIKKQLTK